LFKTKLPFHLFDWFYEDTGSHLGTNLGIIHETTYAWYSWVQPHSKTTSRVVGVVVVIHIYMHNTHTSPYQDTTRPKSWGPPRGDMNPDMNPDAERVPSGTTRSTARTPAPPRNLPLARENVRQRRLLDIESRRTCSKMPPPWQVRGVSRIYQINLNVSRVPSTRSIYSFSIRVSIAYNPCQDQAMTNSVDVANLFDIRNPGRELV